MQKKFEVDFSDLKEIIENLIRGDEKEKDEKECVFDLIITRESNGYVLDGVSDSGGRVRTVVEDDDVDELKSGESLLWTIMEYFNFGGSKHDKERIRVVREKQEK